MSDDSIIWGGRALPFWPGESVASALNRAGIVSIGEGATGLNRAVFCGIGQCQNCLVKIDGQLREACLTLCRPGMVVQPESDEASHG